MTIDNLIYYINNNIKDKLSAKIILNLLIYILFVCCYLFFINDFDHSVKNEKENYTYTDNLISVIYFGLTTHTTVGFGDIIPRTNRLKTLISIHILLTFVVNLIL